MHQIYCLFESVTFTLTHCIHLSTRIFQLQTPQFHFNIPEIKNMELTVKVMDDDVLKDDKMGKCKIKLEKLGLSGTPTHVKEKVHNRIFGEDSYVFLTLTYTE
mmetsp:Transcript_1089/g.1948  ORF Transcript_1089/g.1948 Transcript_1089/m.1948 type:complete len:103 (-) Transcript_1089:436-744(-)